MPSAITPLGLHWRDRRVFQVQPLRWHLYVDLKRSIISLPQDMGVTNVAVSKRIQRVDGATTQVDDQVSVFAVGEDVAI